MTTSLHHRKTVVSAAVFLFCCILWLCLALRFNRTAWDFTGFYIPGNLPPRLLYDRAAFVWFGQHNLAPIGVSYYPPYVRPAVFSLPLHAIMWLPYWTAFTIWAVIQFGCYLAALALLFRRLSLPPLLLIGYGLFYPAMFGIITGQDSNTFLLVLAAGLVLLADGHERAAGLVLGLGVYKFALILLIPVLLLIRKNYRALLCFCLMAGALAAASILLAPPGSYVALLSDLPKYLDAWRPERMIGLRSIAYSVGVPNLYFVLAPVLAVASLWAIRVLPLAEAFSVAVAGSLLCAYFVSYYDAAALAIPIAVALDGRRLFGTVCAGLLLFTLVWMSWPQWWLAGLIVGLWGAILARARWKTGDRRNVPSTCPH